MKCQHGLIGERITDFPVVFSLGAFDGVHIGHQHLLSLGRRLASDHGCLFAVLTFSTLPRQLLLPHEHPSYLTSPFHKRRLLESAGVDLLIEIPFSEELMAMQAMPFLKKIEEMVYIDTWIGGKDLHFGQNQEGGCSCIERRAQETGMKTLFFDRVGASEENVSSTRIRSLVMSGALSQSQCLLGRPYSLMVPAIPSKIFHGPSQFFSFHIDASLLCLPPDGVYAAMAKFEEGGDSYDCLLSIHNDDLSSSSCEAVVNAASIPTAEFLEVTPTIFLRPITEGK
jgi:riboflavin kinase/FMN adenylyltransferase